jgi:hypothetical protein
LGVLIGVRSAPDNASQPVDQSAWRRAVGGEVAAMRASGPAVLRVEPEDDADRAFGPACGERDRESAAAPAGLVAVRTTAAAMKTTNLRAR